MIDYDKLRGALAERHVTRDAVADALGVSRQSATYKLTGKTKMTVYDAKKISDLLEFSVDDRDTIFFANDVK